MKIFWSGDTKYIIGSRIKSLRKAKNLTQKELAEKLQLEGGEFSDITKLPVDQGKRIDTDFEVVLLADFFGITTDELLKPNNKQ